MRSIRTRTVARHRMVFLAGLLVIVVAMCCLAHIILVKERGPRMTRRTPSAVIVPSPETPSAAIPEVGSRQHKTSKINKRADRLGIHAHVLNACEEDGLFKSLQTTGE